MAYSSGRRAGLAFWFSQELVREPWWARVLLGTMLAATRDDGSCCAEVDYLRTTLLPSIDRRSVPPSSAIRRLIDRKVDSGFFETFNRQGVTYVRFTSFEQEQHLRHPGRKKSRKGTGTGTEGKSSTGSSSSIGQEEEDPLADAERAWELFERAAEDRRDVEDATQLTRHWRSRHRHPDDTDVSWWRKLRRERAEDARRRREQLARREEETGGPPPFRLRDRLGSAER